MKTALGIICIVGGAVLGIWLGIFVCCIGGILDVIRGATADPFNLSMIATGIVKFFCASFIGWASWMLCFFVGVGILLS
jgi:hypothetical protein